MEKTKLNVRVELEGELLKKFKIVKDNFGMVRNTEVLHFLICKQYEELEKTKQVRKVPVDPETYQRFEERAKEKGLTVDQYVSQLLDAFIEGLQKE